MTAMTAQHAAAFSKVTPGTVAHRQHQKGVRLNDPVIAMMDAFSRYAVQHEARFESKLSEDYFLGPEWLSGIKAVRALLNGAGDFDAGTLEELFWSALTSAGFTEADL